MNLTDDGNPVTTVQSDPNWIRVEGVGGGQDIRYFYISGDPGSGVFTLQWKRSDSESVGMRVKQYDFSAGTPEMVEVSFRPGYVRCVVGGSGFNCTPMLL